MKTYLFGSSLYASNLIHKGILKDYNIVGLFDNANEKQGKEQFGLKIEKPYFDSGIEIIIATKECFHLEIIKQLMELGYFRWTLFVNNQNNTFIKKVYNYRNLNYKQDKEKLVLLFLEHRSYSNICAIDYMIKNKLLNLYGFRLKIFYNNKMDDEYYYDLVTAKFIITERNWLHKEKCINAKRVQIWHGFPLKAMGHMVTRGDKNEITSLDKFWLQFDHILSYGLNYTVFMSACYGTLRSQYTVTGMPRNDLLYLVDGKKNLTEKIPACQGKRIVLYMPTFRELGNLKNGSDDGYLFYWKDFDLNTLQDFCRTNNLFFLFKLHPSDTSKVVSWCVESDCMGILTDNMLGEQCLYEYLNAADILLTDYSSVYFDYLLLNRPILFTDNDADSYEENRGFITEPVDFWRPGPVVHTFYHCLHEIEKVLEGQDAYQEARKRLLPFVHQYQDAGSSQRLFNLLKSAQEREEVQ